MGGGERTREEDHVVLGTIEWSDGQTSQRENETRTFSPAASGVANSDTAQHNSHGTTPLPLLLLITPQQEPL